MISHTFAVCAYGESPYLEKSIRSVVQQSVKSRVIVCTSTPNEYIEKLVREMKDAGSEEIIAEMQKQVDEFLQNKSE